jgi:hypothetical protein
MDLSPAGYKTICVPVSSEATYRKVIRNGQKFRSFLDQHIAEHPELFPTAIANGYWLHDTLHSKKLNLMTRRIKLVTTEAVYQVRPDFVLPYMVGMTDEAEKALYLRRFGVPFDALAYVFGRDSSYWYRLQQSLGRLSIVGTTVKDPDRLPAHLVADEKHSWRLGERVFIPTTVGSGCFLGVNMVATAETPDLQHGYGQFRDEAQALNPDYQPETVTTDGWEHTQTAWKSLFPGIAIILCFLHSVLDIQQRCRRNPTIRRKLTGRLWHLYQAPSKLHFAQRLRRLRQWTRRNVKQPSILKRLLNLKAKSRQFQVAYDHPEAPRTSNQVDRLMNYQDRLLYTMQYFHGSEVSARLHLRAMVLLWNFHPYGSRTTVRDPNRGSPFQDLNGFVYHDNWLHNLLIAGSMNGYRH